MAEFGNIFNLSTKSGNVNVDVEMLDYSFVKDCNDVNILNSIINVLKSGKEGCYPDLVRFTEDKLVQLLPPKDRKRYLALTLQASPDEIAEAEMDVRNWQSVSSAKLAHEKVAISRVLPPVRGSGNAAPQIAPQTKVVDVSVSDKINYSSLSSAQNLKLRELRRKLTVEAMTPEQRKTKANMEKVKGNESFRVADNAEALQCYSRSLALDDSVAAVWANRAMVYIRTDLFDLAEQDCSRALELEPQYVKALSRRGLVRFKRGKYAQASSDFSAALQLDPTNAELEKLLRNAENKRREVDGDLHGSCVPQDNPSTASFDVGVVLSKDFPGLLLPDDLCAADEVGGGKLLPQSESTSPVASFVRIPVLVESDDDDDEEEEEKKKQKSGVASGFRRIAIAVEDDEDDGDQGEGDTRYADERYEDAERAAVERSQQATAYKESGNALLLQGRAREAVEAYTRSLASDPHFLPSLGNRAQAHLQLKMFPEAVSDCCAVLAREPQNIKALYRRAVAEAALGDTVSAIADIGRVLALDRSNCQARKLCGQLLVDPDSLLGADTVGGSGPPAAEWTVDRAKQRARDLMAEGRPGEVVALLGPLLEDQAVSMDVDSRTSLRHLLSAAHVSLGQHTAAIKCCDLVLEDDPNNFMAVLRRAQCHFAVATQDNTTPDQSALARAGVDVSAALRLDPGHKEAIRLLGEIQSERVADRGSSGSPAGARRRSDDLKERGNQEVARKAYSAAADLYSAAITADPSNTSALNNRALAWLKLQRFDAAVADCGEVLRRTGPTAEQPDTAAAIKALLRRAEAYRGLSTRSADGVRGECARLALSDFDAVLVIDPDHDVAARGRKALLAEARTLDSTSLPPKQSTGAKAPDASVGLLSERSTVRRTRPSSPFGFRAAAGRTSAQPASGTPTKTPQQEAGRAAVSRCSPSQLAVSTPTEPPKTVYELERIWRALKDRPAAFAQYLSLFRASTFRRVVKEALSPEIVSSIFGALRRQFTPSVASRLRTLEAFRESTKFAFIISMLPAEDAACLGEVISELRVDAQNEEDGATALNRIDQLMQLYKVH